MPGLLFDVRPVTDEEVLLSWARAEAPVRWRGFAPPHVEALASGAPLSESERNEVFAFMLRVRGEVSCLLDGRTSWHRARVATDSVGGFGLDPYWTWTALGFGAVGPSKAWRRPHPLTIGELDRHANAPRITLESAFSFEKMRGSLVLLTDALDAPLRVIEGSNRARAIWREALLGRATHASLEVLVGVRADAEVFKQGNLCAALARVGWTAHGTTRVFLVRAPHPSHAFALACPDTQRVTPLSRAAFDGFARLGFQEVAGLGSAVWTWTTPLGTSRRDHAA
jgi:hypothetical protein